MRKMAWLGAATALAACSSVQRRTDTTTARIVKQVVDDNEGPFSWVTVVETETQSHFRTETSFSGVRSEGPDGQDVRRHETLWLCNRREDRPRCFEATWVPVSRGAPVKIEIPPAPAAGSVTGGVPSGE